MRVFTCGGGAGLPRVDDVFSYPWWEHLRDRFIKYQVSSLPTPSDYDSNGTGASFGRMAVAYGLAIPEPQLGEYRLPDDAGDLTPLRHRMFIPDREELYPRR